MKLPALSFMQKRDRATAFYAVPYYVVARSSDFLSK